VGQDGYAHRVAGHRPDTLVALGEDPVCPHALQTQALVLGQSAATAGQPVSEGPAVREAGDLVLVVAPEARRGVAVDDPVLGLGDALLGANLVVDLVQRFFGVLAGRSPARIVAG